MNERIDDFASQCEGKTICDCGQSGFNYEKFAELIVRECAGIALEQKKWVEDMKVHNPHDEHWNKARIQQSQRIVDKILEHFEVK